MFAAVHLNFGIAGDGSVPEGNILHLITRHIKALQLNGRILGRGILMVQAFAKDAHITKCASAE